MGCTSELHSRHDQGLYSSPPDNCISRLIHLPNLADKVCLGLTRRSWQGHSPTTCNSWNLVFEITDIRCPNTIPCQQYTIFIKCLERNNICSLTAITLTNESIKFHEIRRITFNKQKPGYLSRYSGCVTDWPRFLAEEEDIYSPQSSDWFKGPSTLKFTAYRQFVSLTTHFHSVAKLKKSGAIPALPT
jgi:hypothetical protein